jgi:hypothetical protein
MSDRYVISMVECSLPEYVTLPAYRASRARRRPFLYRLIRRATS